MLASLNHPNIAHIHGLEDSSGVRALVMELVEGPTLADRIGGHPIPVDEALAIAKQIAEGLEAAHDQGIIHRDLKPANIKVTPDGTVKVLDFGLAKALEPAGPASANGADSPTLSMQATAAGVILGTAAYMAPEQARGKSVDRRADIWAFGCVLFEMLAGRRAFRSDDVTDTIVAILSKEPEWQSLPPAASGVRPLLERCLRKDRRQRLQAIGDARIRIEELIAGTSDVAAPTQPFAATWSRRIGPAIGALMTGAVLAAAATWVVMRPQPSITGQPSRFQIAPPPSASLSNQAADRDIAVSPDGRHIVYRTGGGVAQLVVRAIDRLEVRTLAGIVNPRQPFFSPDGQWIGFFDGADLKRVSLDGGPAILISRNRAVPRGASWGDDNQIVFSTMDTATGLLRVSAAGGEPTVLTRPDGDNGERNHWFPTALPRGRGILYTITKQTSSASRNDVAVLDLRTGQRKTLIRGGSQAEYVATGHLLYAAEGTLRVVRFDLERLEVLDNPVPVVDQVEMGANGATDYAISRSGTLIFVPARLEQTQRSLVWIGRDGSETPVAAVPRAYTDLSLAPDGQRVALSIADQENDIWIWDFARETLTRLTSDSTSDYQPVWTHDGERVVFASQRTGESNLYAQNADGTGTVERLTTGAHPQAAAFVAPDGSGIVGTELSPATAGDVVWFRAQRQPAGIRRVRCHSPDRSHWSAPPSSKATR